MKNKLIKLFSYFGKLKFFSSTNYYFFKDSKPRGNFGNSGNFIESNLDNNKQDSFSRGLEVFYHDKFIIDIDNPDESQIEYDLIYKDYLKNNSILCTRLKEILSNKACIIQIIGNINELKKFICAFFIFDMKEITTFILNDYNKLDYVINNHLSNCIIISLLDLHSNSGFLNRELNNYIIILTENEISSDYHSLKLSFDEVDFNPF